MRVAELVHPAALVETNRLADQDVAIPAPDREAIPLRVGVGEGGQRAPVHPDFAPVVAILEELQDASRRLHDLERVVRLDDLGGQITHEAERLAPAERVVALGRPAGSVTGTVRLVQGASCRRERRLLHAGVLACRPARHVAEADDGAGAVPVPGNVARIKRLLRRAIRHGRSTHQDSDDERQDRPHHTPSSRNLPLTSIRRANPTFGALRCGEYITVSVSPGFTESRVHPRVRRRVGVSCITADHFCTVPFSPFTSNWIYGCGNLNSKDVTTPVIGPRVWSMKYSTPPPWWASIGDDVPGTRTAANARPSSTALREPL